MRVFFAVTFLDAEEWVRDVEDLEREVLPRLIQYLLNDDRQVHALRDLVVGQYLAQVDRGDPGQISYALGRVGLGGFRFSHFFVAFLRRFWQVFRLIFGFISLASFSIIFSRTKSGTNTKRSKTWSTVEISLSFCCDRWTSFATDGDRW